MLLSASLLFCVKNISEVNYRFSYGIFYGTLIYWYLIRLNAVYVRENVGNYIFNLIITPTLQYNISV